MDIQKQIEYFKGIPYENKKEKILEMLKQLIWTHEKFKMFYDTITTVNNISEKVLIYIYQGIFEIAAEIEAGNTIGLENKIKHMNEVIMAIRQQEEIDKQREGNPDDILQKI